MPRGESRWAGWRGACLVAITYVYFLIFAQFAFLQRLANLGIADAHLKGVMAAMAIGGILVSLAVPRLSFRPSPTLRLRVGLVASAAAAFLSLLPLSTLSAIAVSFLIGAALGLLTVTLATHLRAWAGNRQPLLFVGLGTGVGYLICNLPGLFNASCERQATVAGVFCLSGILVTLRPIPAQIEAIRSAPQRALPFVYILASFSALVWLDSAAFFIIQNTPELKAGTWQGPVHLLTNGLLHLAAALTSAWLLGRRSLSLVLPLSFASLGIACLLLLHPGNAALASVFYPVGVSLYSVALVAYPSLLAPLSTVAERGQMAGWIYAVAGWCASAMGIGMGQNLGHVPPFFVLVAGSVIVLPWLIRVLRNRMREAALTIAVAFIALCLNRSLVNRDATRQLTQIERGRQVYISEGCIHCHSQYVRPNSPDVLLWGPTQSIAEVRLQQPPLIGNRRQGPDLSQIGARRSPLWLKAHFFNPAEVSGSSIMPSFGFLFNDNRGEDLVAYLACLHGAGTALHIADEGIWQPSLDAARFADPALGERLIQRDCNSCHSANGVTRRQWKSSFKRLPPDLAHGPFHLLSAGDSSRQQFIRLAQIAKFGIPATDMPGHEYLSDKDIASIALRLSQTIAQPIQSN